MVRMRQNTVMQWIIVRSAFASFLLGLTLTTTVGAASCDPISTFADGKQPLREIYISPTGNNSTGNGSQANPYQTISRALQGVQPGDAIRLLPGTYAGGTSIGNLVGTSNAPIWIGGVSGQVRPLINGGSTAIQLSRARLVILAYIEGSCATANGINCGDRGDFANRNPS